MSSCFCVGKMSWCTCSGKCRCECTCNSPSNWTEEEIAVLKKDIKALTENGVITEDFEETLLKRTLEIKDNPDMFYTVEEFFEKVEAMKEPKCWNCGEFKYQCICDTL